VAAPPALADDRYADRPAARADDWSGIVRSPDARLGRAAEAEGVAEEGGLEQQRHPGLPEQVARRPETTPDPAAALAEDEDIAADQRAMDQARGLTAVARGYALNEGSDRDLVPGL
jgi:type IV secretion system protein VirD4